MFVFKVLYIVELGGWGSSTETWVGGGLELCSLASRLGILWRLHVYIGFSRSFLLEVGEVSTNVKSLRMVELERRSSFILYANGFQTFSAVYPFPNNTV